MTGPVKKHDSGRALTGGPQTAPTVASVSYRSSHAFITDLLASLFVSKEIFDPLLPAISHHLLTPSLVLLCVCIFVCLSARVCTDSYEFSLGVCVCLCLGLFMGVRVCEHVRRMMFRASGYGSRKGNR